MKITSKAISRIFAVDGALAKGKANYQLRTEQLAMAQAVNQAIQKSTNLLVEAGTGVGKTFAYLIPAVLADQQVVISTGTKNLQDQLFKRDLPKVLETLEVSPPIALLKGRNNYLCEYRLESTLASGRLPDPTAVKHLDLVNRWRDMTDSGDLAELSPLPEDSPVLPYVTSNTENCLGQDCPFIDNCHLANARERARKAKILVVNHHLLLADLVLKEDGFGELLPDTDIFIVDEAHHLAKTAYQFYGEAISSRQINELCREVELEYRTKVTDSRDLMLEAQRLAKEVKEFRLSLAQYDVREDWRPSPQQLAALRELSNKINKLYEIVKINSSRTKGLESCFERLMLMRHTLKQFIQSGEAKGDRINWYETMKSGFRLHTTPLDIDQLFQQSRQRYEKSSWILTSATLSVNNSFNHYIESMGWGDIETLELASSFDYAQQSLLLVPRGLPSIKQPSRVSRICEMISPLVQAAEGRSFILFTSHKALKEGAEAFKALELFECLVQGEESKERLLEKFRQVDNSVLLATGSFWEGIDVSGDDLVLVVIDKLPFAPPDDPILNAKTRQARDKGQNPFMTLQIPDAVLSLKQGCGRLIRSVTDRGVICLCDPRIVSKPYGDIFINSLPPMQRTRETDKALDFLRQIVKDSRPEKVSLSQ